MRDSITGYSVFNDNQMTRGLDARPVILVESDADQSLIGPHLRGAAARCAPGFSRSATLLAAELHLRNGDAWVVAVVDRDISPAQLASNVVATVMYDLEAEALFASRPKVDRYVYNHLVSEQSFATVSLDQASSIVDEAAEVAKAIGWIRFAAHTKSYGISAASLPIPEILKQAISGDYITPAVKLACWKAGKAEMISGLNLEARTHQKNDPDSVHMCNGHDLLETIVSLLGAASGHRPRIREFSRGFHSLIDCAIFAMLSIFEPLRAWYTGLASEELWDCSV